MFELFTQVIIGVVLILLGLSHRKGNLKLLHSYHLKNVKKEDELPFGKLIVFGIDGRMFSATYTSFSSSNFFIFSFTRKEFSLISNILLFSGLIPGVGIILHALFKYNKGIF